MSEVKRLTPPQSRKVNALVRRTCCNCDNGNCILLDDGDEKSVFQIGRSIPLHPTLKLNLKKE